MRRLIAALWRVRPVIYRILDRPGGRRLLAALATYAARRETSDDVALVHRGAWLLRCGDRYFDGSTRFTYRHGNEICGAHAWHVDATRELWFHLYEPQPGDVAVDVGAGIGTETAVLAEAVGAAGRVLAIEAHPDTFRVLEAQVQANGFANVELCEAAVTGAPGPLYIEDREFHERNAVSTEWDAARKRRPVQGLTLDEICRRFHVDRVDFLKMNIEGAEGPALDGMQEMIGFTRHVAIACHDFLDTGDAVRTRERVTRFLIANGFEVQTRDDDAREYVRDHVHGRRLGA